MSTNATLTVNMVPDQPTLSVASQPSCSVSTGSFTIGNYNSAYSYTINPASGVTRSGNTVAAPAGTYTVTASNNGCSSPVSSPVTLNAQSGGPTITTQPTSKTVCSGSTTTFTGSASGSGLTYQWLYNGSALTADHSDVNGTYSGSTTPTLTITPGPSTYFFGGQFSLLVTSSGGCSTTSTSATLTVNALPDQPSLTVASQPTCNVATGTFTITNYNAAYSYSVNPSSGISQSSNTVTAPAGTYTVTASNNGCSSVASSPITLTSPTCSTAVPDLTPIIYARPSTVNNTSPITVVVDVVELLNVATSGLITVKISKEDMVSLSFSASATTVNSRPVQNSVWSFDASSDPDYYILTTNSVIGASDQLSFGLTGTLTPGATAGALTLSAVIVGGSGGESKITNNSDADKIDYFQN